MRIIMLLCAALWLPGIAVAAPDAGEIAHDLLQSRVSDGFQARMIVKAFDSNGRMQPPFKLAMIGVRSASREQLLLRGISPAPLRAIRYIGEAENGKVKLVDGAKGAPVPTDLNLFDSGLIGWDLFTPWWHWPIQQPLGEGHVNGHPCLRIRSQSAADSALNSNVISCVDARNLVSWQTQVYEGDQLLRTITVDSVTRRESGALSATAFTITLANGAKSRVHIYSGDEHYSIAPETFVPLEGGQP